MLLCIVMRKGSNCLFDDLGFDGCVILNCIVFLEKIERLFTELEADIQWIVSVCRTRLEFPRRISRDCWWCYFYADENVKDLVKQGLLLQATEKSGLCFGCRSSPFQDMNDLAAITAITFILKSSQSARKMQQQHLEFKQVGSNKWDQDR